MAEPQFLLPSTKDALLQGDIFENVPFISVRERPLLVARYRGPTKEGREMYGVHKEFNGPTSDPGSTLAPSTPFRWEDRDHRELILVPVLFSKAMVLTHDCEIKWDDHRLLAMVRPVTELETEQQDQLWAGDRTDMFPLKAQDVPPTIEASFVDFCNVTPFRTAGLAAPSVRYASASQSLREAVAGAYWYYLHHPFLEARPNA